MYDILKDFRSKNISRKIVDGIKKIASEFERVKICHVCGTHEYTISKYGIRSLLPKNIEVIEGPGCPVCVTSQRDVEIAIKLALSGKRVVTFGDMARVPGREFSLLDAKTKGADIKVVYSFSECIKISNDGKETVFVAVGFETTMPTIAVELERGIPENLYLLTSMKFIPPALDALLEKNRRIDAIIAPGHVSAIIGAEPYEPIAKKYNMPVVISGFEPLDVLYSIYLILQSLKDGVAKVENEYKRVVRYRGNEKAKMSIRKWFKIKDAEWRGLGKIKNSGAYIKEKDALRVFDIEVEDVGEVKGCRCGDIIRAEAYPHECPLFGKLCTPERPKGPCMVSLEGACRIEYLFGGMNG